MDILFNKWWLRGLMKPLENALLRNCSFDTKFIVQFKSIAKIMKNVIYGKDLCDLSGNPLLNDFVASKK